MFYGTTQTPLTPERAKTTCQQIDDDLFRSLDGWTGIAVALPADQFCREAWQHATTLIVGEVEEVEILMAGVPIKGHTMRWAIHLTPASITYYGIVPTVWEKVFPPAAGRA